MTVIANNFKYNHMHIPDFYPVTHRTDKVTHGSTFIAIRGSAHNGIDYIEEALRRGATKIIVAHNETVSQAILDSIQSYKAVIQKVDNPRRALAYLAKSAQITHIR